MTIPFRVVGGKRKILSAVGRDVICVTWESFFSINVFTKNDFLGVTGSVLIFLFWIIILSLLMVQVILIILH